MTIAIILLVIVVVLLVALVVLYNNLVKLRNMVHGRRLTCSCSVVLT